MNNRDDNTAGITFEGKIGPNTGNQVKCPAKKTPKPENPPIAVTLATFSEFLNFLGRIRYSSVSAGTEIAKILFGKNTRPTAPYDKS
jgi:hypothetical protein